MVEHIEFLLNKASGHALSFCVIVPGWTETKAWQALDGSKHLLTLTLTLTLIAWQALDGSKHLRGKLLIAKDDHGYCDGAQHQRQDRYRASPYDTGLFFLQTIEGAEKWPYTPAAKKDLREAFAASLPSDGMVQRRMKDQLGFLTLAPILNLTLASMC